MFDCDCVCGTVTLQSGEVLQADIVIAADVFKSIMSNAVLCKRCSICHALVASPSNRHRHSEGQHVMYVLPSVRHGKIVNMKAAISEYKVPLSFETVGSAPGSWSSAICGVVMSSCELFLLGRSVAEVWTPCPGLLVLASDPLLCKAKDIGKDWAGFHRGSIFLESSRRKSSFNA